MTKGLRIFLSVALVGMAAATASPVNAWRPATPSALLPLLRVDWQDPQALPRRFRNHCAFDANHGRFYCADHCGLGYQFYFCSRASFGCCRVGYGYCDWRGALRCAP